MKKKQAPPGRGGKKNMLWGLFGSFLKIGALTFGGGYAMIALLEEEFVEKKKWMDREEFLDMVAIAESTPGPIAINAATYIGYSNAGVWGALVATAAVCIPSFLVIYCISLYFDRFLTIPWVARAFSGIRVCVVYLIASAGLKMLRGMKKTGRNLTLMIGVMVTMLVFSLTAVRFSTAYYILICGTVGIVGETLRNMRGGRAA